MIYDTFKEVLEYDNVIQVLIEQFTFKPLFAYNNVTQVKTMIYLLTGDCIQVS